MRFQLTHKLTTYLLVVAAVGTLGSAGLVSPTTVLLTLLFAALSWPVDPGTRIAFWVERAAPALRLGATAFFALCAYEVWARLPEPDLTPVLNLVLFLVVYKLFGRSANRDYLQIYVLAFLMVLAGAAFAQNVLFGVCFTAYVVLTTWTLILLHLRREMEENYLVKHSGNAPSHKVGVARILNSRRVIGGPFLTATAGVALLVCLGSAMTFAVVPRVGAGFALGGARARKGLVGFSDEVTLGTSGFLSTENDTVALRAVVSRLSRLTSERDRESEMDRMYWRGTVYETYQKGRWLRARHEALRSHIVELGNASLVVEPHMKPQLGADPFPPLAGTDRQEIDIVGVSAPVAFALDHPVAFEIPPPKVGMVPEFRLAPRWSGEMAFQGAFADGGTGDVPGELRNARGMHYVAYSRDPFGMTTAVNGRPTAEIPAEILAPYLAVPGAMAPRVANLARIITAGNPTTVGKVVAVIDWLGKTHEYSLEARPAPNGVDPIEHFLFDRKTGHCEYFASAAALLLRSVGVPTRYVNGFLGGEWNELGEYVTVRQNRAHAWVEAYLGELGWMRVDATPPVRPPGRMGKLRQVFDSIEFFWGRWIVGYDIGRQLDLARSLGRSVGLGPSTNEAGGSGGSGWPWRRIALLGGMVSGVTGIWLALRRRRRAITPGTVGPALGNQPVGRAYRRALERLSEHGLHRRPSETPREFATRVTAAGLQGAGPFAGLTELYVRARFGRQSLDDAEVLRLSRALGRLGWPAGQVGVRAA